MGYSPSVGRFIERDPLGTEYQDGFNLYLLEKSNPINNVDPTGMISGGVAPGSHPGKPNPDKQKIVDDATKWVVRSGLPFYQSQCADEAERLKKFLGNQGYPGWRFATIEGNMFYLSYHNVTVAIPPDGSPPFILDPWWGRSGDTIATEPLDNWAKRWGPGGLFKNPIEADRRKNLLEDCKCKAK